MPSFEHALDPRTLENFKLAVRAVHAKRAAEANLIEHEKKRRRAEMDVLLAKQDALDAKLESSQSYEDEPAMEETEEEANAKEEEPEKPEQPEQPNNGGAGPSATGVMHAAAAAARGVAAAASAAGLI